MSTWRERAHAFIATLPIPADADAKECRKIFREHGWRFHAGTYWGRKAWGKATRETLIRRGLVESPLKAMPLLPADIIFPFRDEGRAS